MTEKEKMLAAQHYDPTDEELTALRIKDIPVKQQ